MLLTSLLNTVGGKNILYICYMISMRFNVMGIFSLNCDTSIHHLHYTHTHTHTHDDDDDDLGINGRII